MDKFRGSIAVVTGASAGIGRGIVEKLLHDGDDLIVIGLARRVIDIDNVKFNSIQCDVGDAEQVEAAFNQIGQLYPDRKISILINNAGHAKPLPIVENDKLRTSATLSPATLTEASKVYQSMLNTNVLGATLVVRKAASMFDHAKVGNIVNINSMSGHRVVQSPDTHFYTMTKYAVTALTEATRQEMRLMGSKVRVNQISPGFVATDFFNQVSQDAEYQKKMEAIVETALTVDNIVESIMLTLMVSANCQVGDVQMRPTVQVS